jgi:hypothetical protein
VRGLCRGSLARVVGALLLPLLAQAVLVAPARSEEETRAKADAPEAEPAWRGKFDEVYRLSEGENAKLIAPPFTDARHAFHRANAHASIVHVAGQYGFRWKDGRAERESWSTDPGTVESALGMAELDAVDLEGSRDLFDLKVPGDWIVREGADREAILEDIQRELKRATDGRIRIEPAKVEKDVIVARGRYAFKPLADAPTDPDSVHLFTDTFNEDEGGGGGTAPLADLLRRVGDVAGQKVINETEPHDGDVSWRNHRSANDAGAAPAKRNRLLKNVAAQTSLQFRIERREVDVWRVVDTTGQAGGL